MTHPRQRNYSHGAVSAWTEEEDTVFRRMWAEGASIRTIAGAVGRTHNAVASRRKTLRLEPRGQVGGRCGGAQRRPGDPSAGGRAAASAMRAKAIKRTTPDSLVEDIRRMAGEGLSIADVAGRLGLTRGKAGSIAHCNAIKFHGRKNNNPSGISVARLNAAKAQQGRSKAPEPLPATPACSARVSMAHVGYAQCRFTGELPAIVTVDTPIYCGARTDGGSWCPSHKAVVR
jgi:hypothetical protein